MRELKTLEDVMPWFLAGKALIRVPSKENEPTTELIYTYINKYSQLLPIGILYDIYGLLIGKIPQKINVQNAQLQKVLWEYDESFIGRLYSDSKFSELKDACTGLSNKLKYEAAAFITNHIKDHIKYERGVSINTGFVRKTINLSDEETRQKASEYIRSDENICSELAQDYAQIVKRSRYSAALITDYVTYIIDNIQALTTDSTRLIAKQIVDAEEKISYYLPKVFRKKRKDRGETNTNIKDDSAFPTGGFSSISNRGSFENLACSELIFMENTKEFDLFDVRYAESELLYYTRDENVFTRKHRQIYLVFDQSIADTKFRDKNLPWQRIIVLFGFILCIVKKLVKNLSEDALNITLVFEKSTKVEEEKAIIKILLNKFITSGVVNIISAMPKEDNTGEVLYITAKEPRDTYKALFIQVAEYPKIYVKNKQAVLPETTQLNHWINVTEEIINMLL